MRRLRPISTWRYVDETTVTFFNSEYAYCVEGDSLWLRSTDEGEERVLLYERE